MISKNSLSSFKRRILDLAVLEFSPSSSVDSFAVIEASLTSVKYAFYHVIGYGVLHYIFPHNLPTTSLLTSATSGFIGGALFTIPFLISLGRGNDVACTQFSCNLSLIGAEFFYSMIGGGIGILAIGDWSYIGIIMGMIRSLVGPMTVFTVLYCLLMITLTIISFMTL